MTDPRDPGREQRLAERDRQYREGLAEYRATTPETDDAHLTAAAIANCTLCDSEGYRPSGVVCDHIDRTEIAKAGMAKVRAALAKGKS